MKNILLVLLTGIAISFISASDIIAADPSIALDIHPNPANIGQEVQMTIFVEDAPGAFVDIVISDPQGNIYSQDNYTCGAVSFCYFTLKKTFNTTGNYTVSALAIYSGQRILVPDQRLTIYPAGTKKPHNECRYNPTHQTNICQLIDTYGIDQCTSDADCNVQADGEEITSETTEKTSPTGGVIGQTFGATIQNPLNVDSFEDLLDALTNFIFWVGITIAPIMLIIAGFIYITAAGDSNRITTAKNWIIWTLAGLAVILLARGLVLVIQSFLVEVE
jgi:hypothetical protein